MTSDDGNDPFSDRLLADLPLSDARSAPTHTPASTPIRPELARGAAVQLAEVISTARERSIELKLHPEELGRVSMTLSHDGGALTVALTAERGETLELMRRHIDLLSGELRRLGYGSVDFTFGDGHAGGDRQHGAASSSGADVDAIRSATAPDSVAGTAPRPAHATTATATGGIDIRL